MSTWAPNQKRSSASALVLRAKRSADRFVPARADPGEVVDDLGFGGGEPLVFRQDGPGFKGRFQLVSDVGVETGVPRRRTLVILSIPWVSPLFQVPASKRLDIS